MKNTFLLSALVATLLGARSASADARVCGDVNASDTVTSGDALLVLKSAVGQPVTLTCDQCGSTCEGDPRFLLGRWIFTSEFDSLLYEDNYDLSGVDEVLCQIVGEDLDDGSVIYATTDIEYDYALLDPGDEYCDLFLFDWITQDEVEGVDVLLDLDLDGYCDFGAVLDEGPMAGERVTAALVAEASSRSATPAGSRKRVDAAATSRVPSPEIAAALQHIEAGYKTRRRK